MPYLGNEPATAFTSTTKDTFSGDASTTDFTMSKSANVNAVRVVVENVVQNPTVAYTCSGTTLSFTSAPPTGTNNIYVVHLGPPAATVAPPTTINNPTTFTGGVTLKNETPEDTDGGRESIVTFQGTQSGSEITTLAQIQASHDGTSDDEKGDLIFRTNDGSDGASPTERMRIDSSGHVGIGTSTPDSYYGGALVLDIPTEDGITMATTTTGENYILWADGTSSADRHRGYIGYNHNGNKMRFATDSTDRMLIDSSGNTMINTTTVHGTNSKLSLKTDTDKSGIGITAYKSSNSNYYFMNFIANTTSVGDIYSNGTSTTYATSSDYRLKENVVSVSDASTRLKQLNPVRFNFIADPSTTVDGFFAHEVQDIVPEAIKGVKDGMKIEEYEVTPVVLDDDGNVVTEAVMGTRSVPDYQGIDQSKLVPLLTAALQEAIAKIETLETKVAALEAE